MFPPEAAPAPESFSPSCRFPLRLFSLREPEPKTRVTHAAMTTVQPSVWPSMSSVASRAAPERSLVREPNDHNGGRAEPKGCPCPAERKNLSEQLYARPQTIDQRHDCFPIACSIQIERGEQIHFRTGRNHAPKSKVASETTDHGDGLAVQFNGLAYDLRVPGELTAPMALRQ